jgi:hypothetical protein
MSNHQPLVEYFHKINQPTTVKGLTMFDNVKVAMQAVREKCTAMFADKKEQEFKEAPTILENMTEEYYAFEMVTGAWVNEHGEDVPLKHTIIIEPNDSTWMAVLDTILDSMEEHYGYNIKEQVYYSVAFPMNEICQYTKEPMAGFGRCLNDEILQKLLLAYPEIYKTEKSFDWKPL